MANRTTFLNDKQVELFHKVIEASISIKKKVITGELKFTTHYYEILRSSVDITDEQFSNLVKTGCIYKTGLMEGIEVYNIDADYTKKYFYKYFCFTSKLHVIRKGITPNSELISLLSLPDVYANKQSNGEYLVTDGNTFNINIHIKEDIEYLDMVFENGGELYTYDIMLKNEDLTYTKSNVTIASTQPFRGTPRKLINYIQNTLKCIGGNEDTFEVVKKNINLKQTINHVE